MKFKVVARATWKHLKNFLWLAVWGGLATGLIAGAVIGVRAFAQFVHDRCRLNWDDTFATMYWFCIALGVLFALFHAVGGFRRLRDYFTRTYQEAEKEVEWEDGKGSTDRETLLRGSGKAR